MNTLHVTTREEWRRWLRANHRREGEVLLVYYKQHTGKPRIPYQDALEEALCFGWIDAQVRRIDEERYAQKWTPRRPGSRWSELNRRIARKLIEKGRMTKAGLEAFGSGATTKPSRRPTPVDLTVPTDLESSLRTDKRAWLNFQSLAPSYRRSILAGSMMRREMKRGENESQKRSNS